MPFSLKTELYKDQCVDIWPRNGRHILAHYDDNYVVVYQAFCNEIADYVVRNGCFGGPRYSLTRMTWIKTNFLWMMYRSGWGQKPNQERTLAIYLSREGFEEILNVTREGGTSRQADRKDDVRLQWDPDHCPKGGKLDRRAIQLGLRGDILQKFHGEFIQHIEDITEFVTGQRHHVLNDTLEQLVCPSERVYVPSKVEIYRHIRLDGYDYEETERKSKQAIMVEKLQTADDGACCSELLDEAFKVMVVDKQEGCSATKGEEDKRNEVILCLGGAFNPVHTRHIEAVSEAAKWIESHTDLRVIAAVLAVAPAGYVKTKCRKGKQACMKVEHRIRLCEIASEKEPLIKAFIKTAGSAKEGGERLRREMGKYGAKIAVIVGADRAMSKSGHAKWSGKRNTDLITVCVGREGTTEAIKKAFIEDLKLDRVTKGHFYIIDKELANVSSTDVRKCLADLGTTTDIGEREQIVDDIVSKGWITENCGKYIIDNFDDLYD